MNKTNTPQTQVHYPAGFAWLGLAAVYLGFLSVGFVFHFLPPILPVVIADLGISHGQAGLLMSLFALPGILLSLPGGWLVDRYGERLVGSGGVILMGVGTLLLGLAPSFSLILLARVLSGVGAMVGVVALQRLVVRLFAGRSLGLPVGISGSAVPVGIVIVLNVAGPLAETAGWRIVAQRVGGVTAVIGVVFAVVTWFITRGRELGREQKQDDKNLSLRSPRFRPIWIAGAVWFSANGAMTAFMTFAPDHFQGLGFDVSARGLFTSIPMWTSAALGMITGWLTDRHGGRAAFMTVGMTMMGISLLLLPTAVVPPSLIGLALGLSLAAVVTPTIALPGVLLPPTHIGRGYGLLATCANVGIFIVPPVAGWARDLSGSYFWPFVIMGGVAIGGVVAAEILRRGRFMPGFSRTVLVLALLVTAGCGRQDRYEVVQPETSFAEELTWGHFSDETVFLGTTSQNIEVGDGWSAADFVVGDRYGRLIRIQDDLFTSLHFPLREEPVGIICLPTGDLLLGLKNGGFWRWSAGVWQELAAVPAASVSLLTPDHLGRPLAQSATGERALYRWERDTWSEVITGLDRIDAVWAHPDQGTWLITGTQHVLELRDNVMASDDSLTFRYAFGNMDIAGDGVDRLVVSTGETDVWIRENDTWTYYDIEWFFSQTGMFWHAGRLYTNASSRDLMIWEDDHWQTIERDVFRGSSHRVIEVDGQHLVLANSGSGYLFDGTTVVQISPDTGTVKGLREHQGQLMAFLTDGSLFRAEDFAAGRWRLVGRAGTHSNSGGYNTLVQDDRGRLIAWTWDGLEEWDGSGFSLLESSPYIDFITEAPDGEILVGNSSQVGSLRGGQLTWLSDAGPRLPWVVGAWRRSSTTVDVLTREGYYRVDASAEARLLWVGLGWTPQYLLPLSPDRSLVVGNNNIREMVGDDLRDVTPTVNRANVIRRASVDAVHTLPDGRILAWRDDFEGFMLWDETGWYVVNPVSGFQDWNGASRWPGKFVATEQYGLLLYGPGYVIGIDGEGGAP